MLRLKTNELFELKSVKDNTDKASKPKFKKSNTCTLTRVVIGETLTYNGKYNDGKHFERVAGVVTSFSCLDNKVFVNTDTETYVFVSRKA